MRRFLISLALGIAGIGLPPAIAADGTNVGYRGGSFDGSDLRTAVGGLYDLQVNNSIGATGVTASSAGLNGYLLATSTGEPAEVSVYWGSVDAGGNRSGWANTNGFGAVAEGQRLITNVTVTSHTTYYYRFHATNEQGAGWAVTSATFTTPGAPLLNNGVGARPVGPTVASLNGHLTAGISAALTVFWGLDTNAWSGTNSVGTRAEGPFVTAVAGLTPNTVYYYRCYGTNLYGEGWSDPMAFTTRVGSTSFKGGSYDGYDLNRTTASLAILNVHNASGATNVTASSAWLNGALVSTRTGETAGVRVFWGTTDGTTNLTLWSHTNEFGVGVEGQTFTTNITVLPNLTYYYRFQATNENGEGWAPASSSFRSGGPPTVNTGIGAKPVAVTSAALNGRLTAGTSATLTVLWGSDTNAWSGTNSVGTQTEGPFATAVAGLSPGAVYYYRCHGTNIYGEGWSDIAVFTTRVGSVHFRGGAYDGYDQGYAKTLIRNEALGGTLFIF